MSSVVPHTDTDTQTHRKHTTQSSEANRDKNDRPRRTRNVAAGNNDDNDDGDDDCASAGGGVCVLRGV